MVTEPNPTRPSSEPGEVNRIADNATGVPAKQESWFKRPLQAIFIMTIFAIGLRLIRLPILKITAAIYFPANHVLHTVTVFEWFLLVVFIVNFWHHDALNIIKPTRDLCVNARTFFSKASSQLARLQRWIEKKVGRH